MNLKIKINKEFKNFTTQEFIDWIHGRHKHVQKVIMDYPPYLSYIIKDTGQFANIVGYEEHKDKIVTLQLKTSVANGNIPVIVFGIKPNDLIPIYFG